MALQSSIISSVLQMTRPRLKEPSILPGLPNSTARGQIQASTLWMLYSSRQRQHRTSVPNLPPGGVVQNLNVDLSDKKLPRAIVETAPGPGGLQS